MSKKILGLDLGTTSIGWAYVLEATDKNETSEIIKTGVRVLPLTTDEKTDFEKGKPITTNAERTLKRGARRNLDRYQLRRDNLLQLLKENQLIPTDFIYAENDKNSTFSTYQLRTKAADQEISLPDLAKVLLMINKKRGYKSSRKAKTVEEGQAIDGMTVAKQLYEKDQTPGEYVYELLKNKGKVIPDFYRSDLQNEWDKVWNFQKQFYPEILTDEFNKQLEGKGKQATAKTFLGNHKIYTAENKGSKDEIKLNSYLWRTNALKEQLPIEQVAYVLTEINNNLNNSSGYLGAISDRSKELYFNKQTVGQYQYDLLQENKHQSLKNMVFYRQDYLDEFEKIWQTQSIFHKELTDELKKEIRDIIIFYQRKLKSQKHLISNCLFEKHHKVTPKSSPLFQEYKIWQVLNNLQYTNLKTKEKQYLDQEAKELLFHELNIKGKLTAKECLKILGHSDKDYEANFKDIEGNNTQKSFYEAYLKILEAEGLDNISLSKNTADEIKTAVKNVFSDLGIDTAILEFDALKEGNDFDKQKYYQLWHLLYSVEEDEAIKTKLIKDFHFPEAYVPFMLNVPLQSDYSSLSGKAIKKILPHLQDGKSYDEAVYLAGYGSHSNSLTKEQRDNKDLDEKLKLLDKNSLRNPVVEKILNQMINVVNTIIEDPEMGKPDEIRIELARELKKNAKEREEMTANISKATKEHEGIKSILQKAPFNIKHPTRNDIIRYKLYMELKDNGYHTLYSDTYIPAEKLFSKEFDIEHIIPQSKLYDDSFSNKTIELRSVNIKKGNSTALDFIKNEYGNEVLHQYESRVEKLFKATKRTKYNKLMISGDKIPDGFIDRDIRNTQYIAKKSKDLLEKIVKTVVPTTGMVTDRLREDWGLVNTMQELNFEKYKTLGLTELIEKKDGSLKEQIKDWSKRNDHRHHAMDALTVAFTKHSHIQYLNNLNAKNKEDAKGKEIKGIEQEELHKNERGHLKFNMPMPHFRKEAKEALENILISFKAKNKVVTKNKNKTKQKGKDKFLEKTELTPRGQLHKETIYGKMKVPVIKEEKINASFDLQKIQQVTKPAYRQALIARLEECGNDPKKAFTGKNALDKNPIYLDELNDIKMPEKVKIMSYEDNYTIRKDISPDLKIEKVIDQGVKKALEKRLKDYDNDPKKAFVDLDKNPIWLNEEKGISIKRVTISGVSNAEALHIKKDHLGNDILDENGHKIPVDFVSTGNNHHVAIYRDEKGNLQEEIVSFFEAIERAKQGIPIINKNHEKGWEFLFSMKQNEMFIFSDDEFNAAEIDLKDSRYKKEISKRLFRMQTISIVKYGNSTIRDFKFRHHLETTVEDKKELKDISYRQYKSLEPLLNMVKVRINHLGEIVHVGEY